MATTVGAGNLTLTDWARRLDPDGKTAAIAEVMNETQEWLDDAVWVEGNLPTGHKTTVRSGLPSTVWRMLNYGVAPSKSRTVQVTDTCGMLEAYSEVDKKLAALNGNTAQFRWTEDKAFLESMSQELSDTFMYGNTDTDPEKFLGLMPRYNLTTADNGANIIECGSTTASTNTSIWLVCWGDDTCHMIFPKGSKAGIQHEDLGEETLIDAAGGLYQGYRSHYSLDVGFTVRDWRYVVRASEIHVASLDPDFTSPSANLLDIMVQMIELLPMRKNKMAFICNNTVRSMLRRQILGKSNVYLSIDEVAGKKALMFDGIPVRRCDSILNTEELHS